LNQTIIIAGEKMLTTFEAEGIRVLLFYQYCDPIIIFVHQKTLTIEATRFYGLLSNASFLYESKKKKMCVAAKRLFQNFSGEKYYEKQHVALHF